ncbi:TetR/AcrR family transcriptional regulator [Pseudomonas sp. BN414]|uniref:TetR/AcrR family transcriptional regulator n=1 Tax=Pseudomonas sp. BN414 TaxID=2567888 RepID=UPI002454B7D3|nr:TetR/AcrR family transcriptional regulator [Pseudomonas sp. BN414]MDH4565228.1 TetR/AcrR family transcriptional regulator [Pseudomonas sp. BN414]
MPHALAPSSTEVAAESPPQRHDSRYNLTRSIALELFADRGFSNVSMRDLALRLGISPGSIYNHIEGKEQLLFELIESIYLDLLDLVVPFRVNRDRPETAMVQLMQAHLKLHEDKSQHFRLAEHEFHSLSEPHQEEIILLRRQYEEHLSTLLGYLLSAESAALKSAVPPVLVAILNNLPAWLEKSPLSCTNRSTLLIDMALGALYGALQSKASLTSIPQGNPPLDKNAVVLALATPSLNPAT